MPTVQYDLGYYQAGVQILKEYVLSGEIYWPIGVKPPAGEPTYPQLTLGGLLLARTRLGGRRLASRDYNELARLDREYDRVRSRWRVAWEAKKTMKRLGTPLWELARRLKFGLTS